MEHSHRVSRGAGTPRASRGARSLARPAVTEPSRSRSSVDDEIESLANARDEAQAALRAAQDAYAEACARRDGRVASRSEDEADVLFNASPYVDVRCEYGYIQSNAGLYIDVSKTRPPGVPRNALTLATENFTRELSAMRAFLSGDNSVPGNGEPVILAASTDVSPEEAELMSELRDQLATLTLSNDAIWAREKARPEVPAPWIIKAPYLALCVFLDLVFPENRPIQRFWFLETVARMPYFSYNTMLTVYELLGWWRRSSELRRVHFAEEWNEYHHLLIHESLGGDAAWRDRFLGFHSALLYYGALNVAWLLSPALAYNFSELIEAHAVDTYAQFAEENKAALRKMPAPRIARKYYEEGDLYLFDEFQTARPRSSRRVRVTTLYDAFCAIRDDEAEHVATMAECQMEDSAMADVRKIDLLTGAVLAFIAANAWIDRLAQSAGLDTLEIGGVDVGETLSEDGILVQILRFLPFF